MNVQIIKYRSILIALFLLIAGYVSIPLPDPPFGRDYSTVILDEQDNILRVFLNEQEQWCFPPDDSLAVPEKFKKAVLHFEDRHFYRHPGINPLAIFRALKQNISQNKVISGASTITMQVARLMRPKSRSYGNKLLEMLQALKLELRYSKDEILKLYLDHAPYGGNIVGYQAASKRYYRKFPQQLTWGEAATLAVLPNAPGLISPLSNPDLLIKKRNRLLKHLQQKGLFDEETLQLACLEEIPRQSYGQPLLAAHLSRRLKNQQKQATVIKTTIKSDYQRAIELLVKNHSLQMASLGIGNAAALVVETQTGKVRAYVGSQDFTEDKVDGVQAARSSGSILKPFLYALSMDDGLILPQSLIKDVPTFFGAFSPANADQSYRGIVSAKQALVQSLNVPAARLLNKYGLYSFYYFLKEGGLSHLFREADNYGLPLILGGAETSVWDMAQLYRGLARGGRFSPVYVQKDKVNENYETKELISPGAAWLTLNMMNEVKRPGSEFYWQLYSDQWPLAWKTGTSYGQRDGWAIGVSPQWTIAVWIGNFDGRGNANLSGAGCAGPLLFDIFNYLPKGGHQQWFVKPAADLQEIGLCASSGFLAGPDCPEKVLTSAPVNMKPLPLCPYHKKIFVNEAGDEQLCSLCWHDEKHHAEQSLIYPPDVNQFLRRRGQISASVPPHRKSCPALAGASPLKIIYPQKNASLWIPRDYDGTHQKISFRVAHQQKDRRVYWYMDKDYRGDSIEKHNKALQLGKGWHTLEVIDEAGNRDRVRFYANLKK